MMDVTTTNKINYYTFALYIIVVFLAIFITRQLSFAWKDKKADSDNLYYNLAMIIFPMIILLAIAMYMSFAPKFAVATMVGTIIGCMMIFGFIYFAKTNFSKYFLNQYVLYAIIALFILVGLAGVFIILTGKLRKLAGWSGFFANLFFYIPCMIQNGIRYLINDYNSSSSTMIVLFIIELILFLTYFFLLPIANKTAFPEKIVLQDDPVLLNTKVFLDKKLQDKTKINSAISFWVYLNPAPDTKISYSNIVSETTIFNYSDFNEGVPHIKIVYSNANKGNNDYIMYIGTKPFRISLPFQKWNNFVINFVTHVVPVITPVPTPAPIPTTTPVPIPPIFDTDIFINGNLEMSYSSDTAKKDGHQYNTTFLPDDILYIGSGTIGKGNSNVEGLYGAICNVVYHKTPLSRLAIIYKYNMLLLSNPPLE